MFPKPEAGKRRKEKGKAFDKIVVEDKQSKNNSVNYIKIIKKIIKKNR